MALKQTPSQTIGPFFAYGLTAEQYGYAFDQIATANLLSDTPDLDGQRIRIVGRVLDGNGAPVSDAMIEIWQADAYGRYSHPADPRNANTGFKGLGRCGTGRDPEARFAFDTIKPASVDGQQAPHISVCLFARGLLNHLFTRIYFDDEAEANASDPLLSSIPAERRQTLVAQRSKDAGGVTYTLDIALQGNNETVFLDI